MQKIATQLAWFIAVGCAAALTHWTVVVLTVTATDMAPLLANIIGWIIAFCVSFAGHYTLTFRHQHAPLGRAAARFFFVSALGFVINEAAYAWLLNATAMRYDVLLALVLIGIAGMTFILGRYWAFRRKN
ncbi:GtrA family protein [Parapusillimonas sp. SGNA-6]|nr:GtrA family protein [Parapusillimonas sp. SGNA-6]